MLFFFPLQRVHGMFGLFILCFSHFVLKKKLRLQKEKRKKEKTKAKKGKKERNKKEKWSLK